MNSLFHWRMSAGIVLSAESASRRCPAVTATGAYISRSSFLYVCGAPPVCSHRDYQRQLVRDARAHRPDNKKAYTGAQLPAALHERRAGHARCAHIIVCFNVIQIQPLYDARDRCAVCSFTAVRIVQGWMCLWCSSTHPQA